MSKEAPYALESPVARIEPSVLIEAIACPAFRHRFDVEHMQVVQPFHRAPMENGAYAFIQEGFIPERSGDCHPVKWTRDRNGSMVQVCSPDGRYELMHLGLRDRREDGTPESTPPQFLTDIGGMDPDSVPSASYGTGATNWYYASPRFDVQPPGIRSAEFSIGSADSQTFLSNLLSRNPEKTARLFDQDPEGLADFIRDPFAQIPGPRAEGQDIDRWYRNWWQVANRGLRGKFIPYPGQTATYGFKGYFSHVVEQSEALLKRLGYTHLSGVPSYHHVWNLNLEHGFEPENPEIHERALEFDRALKSVPIPDLSGAKASRRLSDTLRGTDGGLRTRGPLLSWYALLPFTLQAHPNHHPVININHGVEEQFQEAFGRAAETFCTGSGIITYPLAPGENLWHSKQLDAQ